MGAFKLACFEMEDPRCGFPGLRFNKLPVCGQDQGLSITDIGYFDNPLVSVQANRCLPSTVSSTPSAPQNGPANWPRRTCYAGILGLLQDHPWTLPKRPLCYLWALYSQSLVLKAWQLKPTSWVSNSVIPTLLIAKKNKLWGFFLVLVNHFSQWKHRYFNQRLLWPCHNCHLTRTWP